MFRMSILRSPTPVTSTGFELNRSIAFMDAMMFSQKPTFKKQLLVMQTLLANTLILRIIDVKR
jgi:hypothetical protein